MRHCAVISVLAVLSCSQGTDELYARERALPSACRQPITLEQAQKATASIIPTVPVYFRLVSQGNEHHTRKDSVTGVYSISLVEGAMTSMAVAHEVAHVIVFDTDKKDEAAAPIHGEVFVRAYKYTLARMVSRECSDAL